MARIAIPALIAVVGLGSVAHGGPSAIAPGARRPNPNPTPSPTPPAPFPAPTNRQVPYVAAPHPGSTAIGSGIQITLSPQQSLADAPVLNHSIWTGFYPGYYNGIGICDPNDFRYRYMYWQDGCWYWAFHGYNPNDFEYPLIEGVRREDPALAAAIIGPTLPEPDAAMEDLRVGNYLSAASEFLRRHEARLREENAAEGVAIPDRSALRLYALAMAGAGRYSESAERFTEAHRQDPLLGRDPVDGGRVLASVAEARRIMLDAMGYAKRADTSDSWAMVGYLMQTQGRYDAARSMLARADAKR